MLGQKVLVTGWSYNDLYYYRREGTLSEVEDSIYEFPIEVTFDEDEAKEIGRKDDLFKVDQIEALNVKEEQK